MQLSVKDVANLLKVNEKTVYRWLSEGKLPAYKIGNQYRFNRAELLEWVTSRQLNFSPELFQDTESRDKTDISLESALRRGGIYYRIDGQTKEDVLRNVINLMKLPESVDREYLLQMILAREAMASTAIGDGIAIPHVRNPIVLHIGEPIVSLCFLESPVDFHALDGKPVFCLFTLVSPTVKCHLSLLSRLAYVLRDRDFKTVLENQAARERIYTEIVRIESGLMQHSDFQTHTEGRAE
ncbi:MAG TPA: PTS sugar transporter subunit IIA [Anaerohalosphaeraceae bacterium]|nr:PTS sugar transporter subunit IIA [Anaerohalosphaeraceae bacterium]HPP55870.1 PTS sugar transporter subunit IIA [Anaerohalosphaeraceae bacterium]